jgi:hypothetical protein
MGLDTLEIHERVPLFVSPAFEPSCEPSCLSLSMDGGVKSTGDSQGMDSRFVIAQTRYLNSMVFLYLARKISENGSQQMLRLESQVFSPVKNFFN